MTRPLPDITLLAACLTSLLLTAGCTQESQQSSPSPDTSQPPPTISQTPSQPSGELAPQSPAPAPPTVPSRFGKPAAAGTDAVVTVLDTRTVQHQADGAGEVSGPAVDVDVELSNSSNQPLALNGVTVTMTFRTTGEPAVPLPSKSTPFSGVLRSGNSQTATYRFRYPPEQGRRVSVAVQYQPERPTVKAIGVLPVPDSTDAN
jgi:hypothetical protein